MAKDQSDRRRRNLMRYQNGNRKLGQGTAGVQYTACAYMAAALDT